MPKLLFGPELIWLLLFAAAWRIAKANRPPTWRMDRLIKNAWLFLPYFALATFALWWVPMAEKQGLLLRVWASALIGAHFVLDKIGKAYSQQGPGIGMGYVAGMLFLLPLLVTGSVVIILQF